MPWVTSSVGLLQREAAKSSEEIPLVSQSRGFHRILHSHGSVLRQYEIGTLDSEGIHLGGVPTSRGFLSCIGRTSHHAGAYRLCDYDNLADDIYDLNFPAIERSTAS